MILKFKLIAITCFCNFYSPSLAFARVPKEIISEADNRVFDAIRQNAIDVNELRVDVALWQAAGKKNVHEELLSSNYYQSSAILSPFSFFHLFCFPHFLFQIDDALATKIKRKDKR
jgi:hypothetical protein